MTHRQGVEIDYCSHCRGVWLDRGELDKLVQMSTANDPVAAPAQPPAQREDTRRRADFEDSDYGRRRSGQRRKSWLSDLFD
jgi:Zn-finger nucleic acid-binding protein